MVTVIHILILCPPEIKLISLSEKSSATVWHTFSTGKPLQLMILKSIYCEILLICVECPCVQCSAKVNRRGHWRIETVPRDSKLDSDY